MRKVGAELAVIGGGPAGVCAAITAARRGVKTALVTDRPVLGGNSSSEIRVWTRGASGAGNLWAEEMGVWGEIKLENLYRNPEANPVFWDDVLLDAVLKEQDIELFLNTEVFSVATRENGVVASVYGIQQGSEQQIEFEADMFIDATGDGTIGAKAGVPFSVGNGKRETLGNSILYYTKKEDHAVSFVAPDYAYDMAHIEKILGCGGRIINEKMSGSDCWWFEYGGLRDTIKDAQDIALELRRLVLGVWNYVKNSGKFNADCYTLDWIGAIPGKRESRRMKTEYCLTKQNILAQTTFPDGAFYGGWYVDAHPSGGMYDSGEENCVQIPVNIYQIPLRCLYNCSVPNLLFAGRNIGVDRSVFFSSRIMNTCALSGQAAGTLAVSCLNAGKAPIELDGQEIEKIRQTLAYDDMLIPGAELREQGDITAKASVMASSTHDGHPGEAIGQVSLKDGGFVTFPAVRDGQIQIEIYAEQPTALRAKCTLAKLPNWLSNGHETTEHQWNLQGGLQIIKAEIIEENQFCLWTFDPNPLVSLTVCDRVRTGFLCGQVENPNYYEPRAWYRGEQMLYSAEQVISGESRPWGQPNAWIAAPEDKTPQLELRWNDPVKIQEVRFYLDPDLTMEIPSSHASHWEKSHFFAARKGMPAQLVKGLRLTAETESSEIVQVVQLDEQHQRLVTIRLPEARKVKALRVDLLETWGGEPPAIYRIRIF